MVGGLEFPAARRRCVAVSFQCSGGPGSGSGVGSGPGGCGIGDGSGGGTGTGPGGSGVGGRRGARSGVRVGAGGGAGGTGRGYGSGCVTVSSSQWVCRLWTSPPRTRRARLHSRPPRPPPGPVGDWTAPVRRSSSAAAPGSWKPGRGRSRRHCRRARRPPLRPPHGRSPPCRPSAKRAQAPSTNSLRTSAGSPARRASSSTRAHRGPEGALRGRDDDHPRPCGHRGGGHRTVDPHTGTPTSRRRPPPRHRRWRSRCTARRRPHPRPPGPGPPGRHRPRRRALRRAARVSRSSWTKCASSRPGVVLVAQGVEHRDVQGEVCRRASTARSRQKRSGCAASHSLAALSSSGSATGASAG